MRCPKCQGKTKVERVINLEEQTIRLRVCLNRECRFDFGTFEVPEWMVEKSKVSKNNI